MYQARKILHVFLSKLFPIFYSEIRGYEVKWNVMSHNALIIECLFILTLHSASKSLCFSKPTRLDNYSMHFYQVLHTVHKSTFCEKGLCKSTTFAIKGHIIDKAASVECVVIRLLLLQRFAKWISVWRNRLVDILRAILMKAESYSKDTTD